MSHDRSSPSPPLRLWILLPVMILGVVITVVSVILTAPIQPLQPHFPPEVPEIQEKRRDPANGFYTLEKAAELMILPMNSAPWDTWSDHDSSWKTGWTEDPQREAALLAYFEEKAPAIDKMREGLSADYYFFPEVGNMDMPAPFLAPWRRIARTLTAQGKWLETEGRYSEAIENYLDSVRLGMTVGSDGPLICRLLGIAIEGIALGGLSSSLHHYDDPEILRQALTSLKEIAEREAPLSKIFEFEFRTADNSLTSDPDSVREIYDSMMGVDSLSPPGSASPFGVSGRTSKSLKEISRDMLMNVPGGRHLMARADLVRHNRNRGKFYDGFLNAVDLPFTQFQTARPPIPEDPFSQMIFPALPRVMEAVARQESQLQGSLLAVALRLYRIENGQYPDNQDVLVPTYLDELPVDPFINKPFHYEKVGDDFLLYSVGRNAVDDGGLDDHFQGDEIIHQPPDEWRAREAES